MPLLTIGEAATRLHTTPSTIRSWEQRLGYPHPKRTGSGHRLYDESQIALLGDALSRGLTISSAIRQIKEETGSHANLLRRELVALRFTTCDRLLEASIALRGVRRAFDEVVMEAIEDLLAESDHAGANALAIRWVKERALWYWRLATAPVHGAVVVADTSHEISALRAASDVLQLQLRLRGFSTNTLTGSAVTEFRAVAELVQAAAIVFVGDPPAMAGRSVAMGPAITTVFRGAARARDTQRQLPPRPRLAADELWSIVRDSSPPPANGHAACPSTARG